MPPVHTTVLLLYQGIIHNVPVSRIMLVTAQLYPTHPLLTTNGKRNPSRFLSDFNHTVLVRHQSIKSNISSYLPINSLTCVFLPRLSSHIPFFCLFLLASLRLRLVQIYVFVVSFFFIHSFPHSHATTTQEGIHTVVALVIYSTTLVLFSQDSILNSRSTIFRENFRNVPYFLSPHTHTSRTPLIQ